MVRRRISHKEAGKREGGASSFALLVLPGHRHLVPLRDQSILDGLVHVDGIRGFGIAVGDRLVHVHRRLLRHGKCQSLSMLLLMSTSMRPLGWYFRDHHVLEVYARVVPASHAHAASRDLERLSFPVLEHRLPDLDRSEVFALLSVRPLPRFCGTQRSTLGVA